ncbi:RNA polymerase II transcription elongation factor-domain-containing protein [Scleroderma yunnanense]
MASADTQWMPTGGRHRVSIGTSLARALRARKGATQPKRTNLPDRNFYSFRYNFKPESIDPDRPGSVEVKRGKESTTVTLERPSTQPGENHLFKGLDQPVKEYDCVLIYDEELGTFTLEKIDGFTKFSYDRKVQGQGTNVSRKSSSPKASASKTKDTVDLDKELEELLGTDDADGEPDDEFEEVITTIVRREEEEEEDDPPETSMKPPSPVRAPEPPPKPKMARLPPKKQESLPKPKVVPKEVPKPKKEPETRRMVDSVMVEELDPGVLPARPTKRQKSASSIGLALPGASSSIDLPSSHPPPSAPEPDDSDSDEWESVPVNADPEVDLENDAEEIDLDEFGREMEAELGGTEDDGSPEPDGLGRPMSLNQFAGGQFSDVSSSSSEDSDDE